MKDWDAVTAFALSLPDTELASHYGSPVPKLNGKALIAPGREGGSFCLMVTKPEKEILLETDPDTFWETDHYRGWPAILVRYGTDARDRIETYIQRRWWDCAKKAQREAFGDRP